LEKYGEQDNLVVVCVSNCNGDFGEWWCCVVWYSEMDLYGK